MEIDKKIVIHRHENQLKQKMKDVYLAVYFEVEPYEIHAQMKWLSWHLLSTFHIVFSLLNKSQHHITIGQELLYDVSKLTKSCHRTWYAPDMEHNFVAKSAARSSISLQTNANNMNVTFCYCQPLKNFSVAILIERQTDFLCNRCWSNETRLRNQWNMKMTKWQNDKMNSNWKEKFMTSEKRGRKELQINRQKPHLTVISTHIKVKDERHISHVANELRST